MLLTRILNWAGNARIQEFINVNESLDSEISVVMPIFDQEQIVYKHLMSLCDNMVEPFELIVIDDASTDTTYSEIIRFLGKYNWKESSCVRIYFVANLWPWFETRCDDYAIRLASSKYVLEIQADMLIREMGFDRKLIELLKSDSSNFALSARGVHTFTELNDELDNQNRGTRVMDFPLFRKIYFKLIYVKNKYLSQNLISKKIGEAEYEKSMESVSRFAEIFPDINEFSNSGRAGFLGTHIESLPYSGTNDTLVKVRANSGRIWYGETVMRGPLILDRDKYLELGGFNTEQFFLGNDDHDLNLRIRDYGYKVGFTPIEFASPLTLGNSRKKPKLTSKIWRRVHRFARRKKLLRSALFKFLGK